MAKAENSELCRHARCGDLRSEGLWPEPSPNNRMGRVSSNWSGYRRISVWKEATRIRPCDRLDATRQLIRRGAGAPRALSALLIINFCQHIDAILNKRLSSRQNEAQRFLPCKIMPASLHLNWSTQMLSRVTLTTSFPGPLYAQEFSADVAGLVLRTESDTSAQHLIGSSYSNGKRGPPTLGRTCFAPDLHRIALNLSTPPPPPPQSREQ